MTADKGRTSVLAGLTAEIMESKKTEARKLTPVAGERGGAPMERAQIPNDTGLFMSNEALYGHAKQLRKFAADAIAIADGIDTILNESSAPVEVVDLDVERKAREAAADAKFAADFAAKQEAAKAATFVGSETLDEDGQETFDEPESIQGVDVGNPLGWACPAHGKATEKTSEKTGKTYIGCPDCNSFKR